MKRTVTLIKFYSELELAHLYEHLYLGALVQFMTANGLLDYIDYRWHGNTHTGFILVSVSLISPEAKQLEPKLSALVPDFSEQSLENSYVELASESKQVIAGYKDLILSSLHEIHSKPWLNIESLSSFDAKKVRRSRKVIWETTEKAKTKLVGCTVLLDNDFAAANRDLLPLFHVVSMALLQNIYASVNRHLSFYYHDQKGTYSAKVVSERDRYRVWSSKVNLDDIIALCEEELSAIIKMGLVSKLETFVRAPHPASESVIPSEQDVFELCAILIGHKGWQEIGTKMNVRNILRASSLQITIGKNTELLRLGKFLASA